MSMIRLNRARHAGWLWRPGLSQARDRRVVPLVWSEIAQAASCFPIVLRPEPGQGGRMPHGLLKRDPEAESVFVTAKGMWQAQWLPPRLAALPFDLIAVDAGQSYALAVDEQALLDPKALGGAPVFAQDGSLTRETQTHTDGLRRHASCLVQTLAQVAAIEAADLLVPLKELQPDYPGAGDDMVIDQARLAALDGPTVGELHQSGVLPLIYGQVNSMQHFDFMIRAERAPDRLRCLSRPRPEAPGAAFMAAFSQACIEESAQTIHVEPMLSQ